MLSRTSPLTRLALVAALVILALASPAGAQPAAPAPAPAPLVPGAAPPEGSWVGQLDLLSRWMEQHRKGARCTERCYALDKLHVTGKVGDGPLRFELTGSVLADGPVAVPLFGPPNRVRIEGATEDGKPAVIGFEGDHYYLHTASRRFKLEGALSLDGDLALTIPGPLNALEADVTAGAVVEGARLTGLASATVHFTREGAAQATGPTVFQLSRAVRVGKEIGFEYRLVMRSGADLGVVRLPLAFGEKVLDVTGSTGWRIEDKELVLPTSGRTAEMRVTGSFAEVKAFSADPRSGYEWWLLESDAEHRVKVTGDARQVDAAESPIPRTQPTARLFLLQKGQRIEIGVTPLLGMDVLAAVVRDHHRRVVLTNRGDLVTDDQVSYENNGIDYLLYAPGGRPIYLATDGKAERIMHQGKESREVLVPLRTGSHAVRVQALADAFIDGIGGRLELPMPSYPLTASRVSVSVGLPARVLPLALLGGDRPKWVLDAGDAVAVVLGFVVAWLAVRTSPGASRGAGLRMRFLGGCVLAGLWFLSGALYAAVVTVLVAVGIGWVLSRLLRGARLAGAMVLIFGAVGMCGLIAIVGLTSSRSPSSRSEYASDVTPSSPAVAPSAGERKAADTGNFLAQTATGGVLEGVTPVALTLPTSEHTLSATRELVTRERPFQPTLYYVTERALWPLFLVWLASALVLLAAHRAFFADLVRRARERLASPPTEPPTPPAT